MRPLIVLATSGVLAATLPGLADETPRDTDAKGPAAIDAFVEARLTSAGLTPAPVADAATFLRRARLDLTGTLPDPAEIRAYVADAEPGKRARLVRRLTADPAFARHLARTETDRLLKLVTDDGGAAYYRQAFTAWLERSLRAGRGWDRIAGDVTAVEGDTATDPATVYALDHARQAPEDMAGAVSRHFLGLRLECARCHDHPFADTTQAQFHGVAAYFARLRLRQARPGVFRIGESPLGDHRYDPAAGKRRSIEPALPAKARRAGYAPKRTTRNSRRAAFARWLTSPDNPWFARAAVNTAWARLFGRGLVPEDLAASEGEPFGPLLDQLARGFARDGFNLQRLYARLAASRAYARAAQLPAARRGDLARLRSGFGAAAVRPLAPATLAEALLRAAGRDRPARGELPRLHARLRLGLIRDLRRVVPPTRDGEAPAADAVTTANALYMLNGRAPTRLIRGNGLTAALKKGSLRARIDALFLRTLSRRPTSAEARAARKHLRARDESREAWVDLFWALIATTEFTTNH